MNEGVANLRYRQFQLPGCAFSVLLDICILNPSSRLPIVYPFLITFPFTLSEKTFGMPNRHRCIALPVLESHARISRGLHTNPIRALRPDTSHCIVRSKTSRHLSPLATPQGVEHAPSWPHHRPHRSSFASTFSTIERFTWSGDLLDLEA